MRQGRSVGKRGINRRDKDKLTETEQKWNGMEIEEGGRDPDDKAFT